MRLIDADELREYWLYNGLNERIYDTNDVLESIDDQPTIDPEPLRPTAHIMRGTVRDTYDNAFCSSCRSCLNGDEYFEEVLAHRYKYCPYCGARMVNTDEKHCT